MVRSYTKITKQFCKMTNFSVFVVVLAQLLLLVTCFEKFSFASSQNDANALCTFKGGFYNWPANCFESSSSLAWDCNEGVATTVPCGSGQTQKAWFGVSCQGENVYSLNLKSCGLSGTISNDISGLRNLQYLHLNDQGVGLTGGMPTGLFSLSALKELNLNRNNLNGFLPEQLSWLVDLEVLDLSNNTFAGSLPYAFFSMTKLREIQLYANNLTGNINSALFQLTSLTALQIHSNSLSGTISAQISSLYNLQSFNAGLTLLSGPIPSSISSLTQLSDLRLANAMFTGKAGSFLCIDSVRDLELNGNRFTCISSCVTAKTTKYDASLPLCASDFVLNADYSSNWVKVLSKGPSFGTTSLSASYTNYLFSRSNVFVRLCEDCADSHKTIVYSRISSKPISIYSHIATEWASLNNSMGVDFNLYSSYADYTNAFNPWEFCNYDGPNVGFPRDCGPDSFYSYQWATFDWIDPRLPYYGGGVADVAYFIPPDLCSDNTLPLPSGNASNTVYFQCQGVGYCCVESCYNSLDTTNCGRDTLCNCQTGNFETYLSLASFTSRPTAAPSEAPTELPSAQPTPAPTTITYDCIDKQTPSALCCTGSITIDASVTDIADYAFYQCQITAVAIPFGVSSVGMSAFSYNNLESVSIPDSVTLISYDAFRGNKLTNVSLGEGLMTINDMAFADNDLYYAVLPESVVTLDQYAFSDNPYRGSSDFCLVYMGTKFLTYPECGGLPYSEPSAYPNTYPNSYPTSYPTPKSSSSNSSSVTTGCVDKYSQRGFCCTGDIEISNEITVIVYAAFDGCSITSVIIPNTITFIGSYSFNGNELVSIVIPDSVLTIAEGAFSNNVLTSVFTGNNVTEIEDFAFIYNRITSVSFGNKLSFIGSGAFYSNALTSIYIPSSVSEIKDSAFGFNKFTSLPSIPSSVTYLSGFNDNQIASSIVIPDTVVTIGNRAFFNNQISSSLIIPGRVTTIGSDAFGINDLESVNLGDNVYYIGDFAFSNNKLSSVTIPRTLQSLGQDVFYGNNDAFCLSYLGDTYFYQYPTCSLNATDFPTFMPTSTPFILITTGCVDKNSQNGYCCSGDIEISIAVTVIESSAFDGCSLTSVIIPTSITSIGEAAFNGNNLVSIVIPDSVLTIGNRAFAYNNLASAVIGNNVTSIGVYAFSYNKIKYVVLGNKLTSIGDGSFFNNRLYSVDIPTSVATIGDLAFYNNTIYGATIPFGVNSIGDSAFYANKLMNIFIPDSVTYIGDGAFSYNSLSLVFLSSSVKYIGKYAFNGNKLADISIPDSLTSIEEGAFSSNYLASVTIPASIYTIGNYAFYNNKLTSVILGNSLTSIGDAAFYDNKLASVTIPKNLVTLGQNAFYGNNATFCLNYLGNTYFNEYPTCSWDATDYPSFMPSYLPTLMPTGEPTFMPTFMPTKVEDIVNFKFSFTIAGSGLDNITNYGYLIIEGISQTLQLRPSFIILTFSDENNNLILSRTLQSGLFTTAVDELTVANDYSMPKTPKNSAKDPSSSSVSTTSSSTSIRINVEISCTNQDIAGSTSSSQSISILTALVVPNVLLASIQSTFVQAQVVGITLSAVDLISISTTSPSFSPTHLPALTPLISPVSLSVIAYILLAITVIFTILNAYDTHTRLLSIWLILPQVSYLSSLVYIANTVFSKEDVLISAAVFTIAWLITFVYEMYMINAYPMKFFRHNEAKKHLLWMRIFDGYVLKDGVIKNKFFENHDNLGKLFTYVLSWIFYAALQVFTACLYGVYVVLHVVWWILMLIVAMVLYNTHSFCNTRLWNTWLRTFTFSGDKYIDRNIMVDTGFLNRSLMTQYLLHDIPVLIIMFCNGGVVDATYVVCIFLNLVFIFRFVYYSAINWKLMVSDCPLDINIFGYLQEKVTPGSRRLIQRREHRSEEQQKILKSFLLDLLLKAHVTNNQALINLMKDDEKTDDLIRHEKVNESLLRLYSNAIGDHRDKAKLDTLVKKEVSYFKSFKVSQSSKGDLPMKSGKNNSIDINMLDDGDEPDISLDGGTEN